MLLWINGPFGGGKTQTAFELKRRLPASVVCDPEMVGYGLHRMLPAALRADFQDIPAWRQGVFEVLDLTLHRYDGVVIAPMTVTEPQYFADTVGRLRDAGHRVHHVALLADRAVVLRRLTDRGLGFGKVLRVLGRQDRALQREAFAVDKLDGCLERLARPEFAEQIWTDAMAVPEVADRVAELAGLTLTPNAEAPLRQRLRQIGVTVDHLRW